MAKDTKAGSKMLLRMLKFITPHLLKVVWPKVKRYLLNLFFKVALKIGLAKVAGQEVKEKKEIEMSNQVTVVDGQELEGSKGIKELAEALDFVGLIVLDFIKEAKDKFEVGDIISVFLRWSQDEDRKKILNAGVKGLNQIPAEVANLSFKEGFALFERLLNTVLPALPPSGRVEKLGIKETREAVAALEEITVLLIERLKDGLQLGPDVSAALQKWTQDAQFKDRIMAGLSGIRDVGPEIKDLSVSEGFQLMPDLARFGNRVFEALKTPE